MRLYISGPITGYPEHNRTAFSGAKLALLMAGHEVLNPHDVCTVLDIHDCKGPCNPSESLLPWEDYLRADLVAMLLQCDALAMLPGWEHSRGAMLEHSVAVALGWEVRPWQLWL
jgi:hypothetical protein